MKKRTSLQIPWIFIEGYWETMNKSSPQNFKTKGNGPIP